MAATLFLSGVSTLSLDDKSRLSLPARFRRILEDECQGQCTLTVSLFDNCLWLYPQTQWEELLESICSLPISNEAAGRALSRVLLGNAVSFKLDNQGRFLLPKNLRDFASLKREVALLGFHNKFEIWSSEALILKQEQDRALAQEALAADGSKLLLNLRL